MKTPDELKILHQITSGEDWKLIHQVFDQHIAELGTLAGIDLKLSPEDLKVEMMARQKAIEKLNNILEEVRGYGVKNQPVDTPLLRSMR